jgi:diaminopimelate decarboxylase
VKSPEIPRLSTLPQVALPQRVVENLRALATGRNEPVSCYLYDQLVAATRAATLIQVLPSWARVFYAVKANGFQPILRALATQVAGFDVSSIREGEWAVAAAPPDRPTRLIASGPGKSEPNLAGLLRLGVELINAESAVELRRVSELASAAGQTARVTVRVNPSEATLPGGVRIGGKATPFGIAAPDVPAALVAASAMPALDVVGFHFHEMCNNLDAETHAAYVQWCLTWSGETAAAHGIDLRVINVGGGLGVTFDQQEPFDLGLFGRLLHELHPPRGTQVFFEPGRWLVADSGFYAAEVTDLKNVHGSWFVVLRGGINHFMRPAISTPHTFAVLPVDYWPHSWPRPELRQASVNVVGELCTPADVLTRNIYVDRIRPGDIVVFPRAGSYGWEVALHNFLGHPSAPRLTIEAVDG